MLNNASIISDLTLALLYLTSWEEGSGEEYASRRSWKGYDFDILNELNEHDFIAGRRSNKSVYLTEEGVAKAQEVVAGLKNGTLHMPRTLSSDNKQPSLIPSNKGWPTP